MFETISGYVPEISKVLYNILIFMIVQGVFFYTVSASFANNIISDKVGRISDIFYKQLQRPQKELLLRQLKDDKAKIQDEVVLDKQQRDRDNLILLLYRLGIPSAIVLGIFVGLLYTGDSDFWANKFAYIFMFFAYATEAGIFFILMNRYEYIGTFEILDKINEQLPEVKIDSNQLNQFNGAIPQNRQF